MAEIKISYDGSYPNLCSGSLIVFIDDKEWQFPLYCLTSGGSVTFDDDWEEYVDSGEWSISVWPQDFPEKFKKDVLIKINRKIPHGCCGGCV